MTSSTSSSRVSSFIPRLLRVSTFFDEKFPAGIGCARFAFWVLSSCDPPRPAMRNYCTLGKRFSLLPSANPFARFQFGDASFKRADDFANPLSDQLQCLF